MERVQSQYNRILYPPEVTLGMILTQTLSDADFRTNPERYNNMPGQVFNFQGIIGESIYREVYVDGVGKFKWVCNRSGGKLLKGNACSYKRQTGTVTSGTTSSLTALVGSFVEHENRFDTLYITDDAGAAGAAPEGEWGRIMKASLNAAGTHITFLVQTPYTEQKFTVAPAAGDTFAIRSGVNVIPCNATDEVQDFAGIVVNPNGIADNYWGWICEEADFVGALIKAATGITEGLGIRISDAADGATISLSRVMNTGAAAGVAGLVLGRARFACSADIVSDFIPIELRPGMSADES
jgi:hypothetical protein